MATTTSVLSYLGFSAPPAVREDLEEDGGIAARLFGRRLLQNSTVTEAILMLEPRDIVEGNTDSYELSYAARPQVAMTSPEQLAANQIGQGNPAYAELFENDAAVGWLRVEFRSARPARHWWERLGFVNDEITAEPNGWVLIQFRPERTPRPPAAPLVDDLFREAELPYLVDQLLSGELTYLDAQYRIQWLSGNKREIVAAEQFLDVRRK